MCALLSLIQSPFLSLRSRWVWANSEMASIEPAILPECNGGGGLPSSLQVRARTRRGGFASDTWPTPAVDAGVGIHWHVACRHFLRASRQLRRGLQIRILSFRRGCGQWKSSRQERERFPVGKAVVSRPGLRSGRARMWAEINVRRGSGGHGADGRSVRGAYVRCVRSRGTSPGP